MAWLRKLLGPSQTYFLLAVPNAKGETALDLALGAQMWEFVRVLAPSAYHVRSCILYSRLLMTFQASSLKSQNSSQVSLTGAVGGTLNKLWDGLGGSFKDSDLVRGHRTMHNRDVKPFERLNQLLVLSTVDDILDIRQHIIDDAVKKYGLHAAEATKALQGCGWKVDDQVVGRRAQISKHSTSMQNKGSYARCIICFETPTESTMVNLDKQLPCGHVTCKPCWQGFLESRVSDGCLFPLSCPNPGCGLALDLSSVQNLLDDDNKTTKLFKKYKSLLAEGFVAACTKVKWCPVAGCGACLLLLTDGRKSPSKDRVTVRCPKCNRTSCWHCNEPGHEPASCSQMADWRRQLESLKAAAPESSRIWLQRNTRQCPVCGCHVQRHGGCNHMTCPCGAQWCWECRRPWSHHGTETGGFYFCNLEEESGEGGTVMQPEKNGGGTMTGYQGGGWLRQAWSALASLASHDVLERAVQQHVRHECDEGMLYGVARHMECLMSHIQDFCFLNVNTNTVLDIRAEELETMDAREWMECMTAACVSLVECSLAEKTQGFREEEGDTDGMLYTFSMEKGPDVNGLAALVVDGHRVLQSSAAVLWEISGGPRRRYLLELCHAVEECLMRVESALVHIPYRQQIATGHMDGIERSTFGKPHWARSAQGALASLFSIPLPADDARIIGLSTEALMAQMYYVWAFIHAYNYLGLREEAGRLGETIEALMRAGKDGLFVS